MVLCFPKYPQAILTINRKDRRSFKKCLFQKGGLSTKTNSSFCCSLSTSRVVSSVIEVSSSFDFSNSSGFVFSSIVLITQLFLRLNCYQEFLDINISPLFYKLDYFLIFLVFHFQFQMSQNNTSV